MIRITLLTVGKIKEKFYADALAEYAKRLSKYCKLEIVEVSDEKTPDHASDVVCNQIKDKEGERILAKLPKECYVIALAIDGKKYDSVAFANRIDKLAVNGNSQLVFVIGGSLGLSDAVLKRSNEQISFSDMTFPHQLMRVILLEQIYRAYRILNNEPYHK